MPSSGAVLAMLSSSAACALLLCVAVAALVWATRRGSASSSSAAAWHAAVAKNGPPPPPVKNCPAGYANCTDAKFNDSFSTGASAALDRAGFVANQLCCKFSNAGADTRPDCQRKVQKNVKIFSIVFTAISALIAMLPLPGVSITLGMMLDYPLGALQNTIQGGILSKTVGAPMTSCQACKGDFFKNDDKRAIVVKTFKGDDGADMQGMWTAGDGCPVQFGTPDSIAYADAIGEAIKAGFPDNPKWEPDVTSNKRCDAPGATACTYMISQDEWVKGGKKPLSCYIECPGSNPATVGYYFVDWMKKGKCNLRCDTSGKRSPTPYSPVADANPDRKSTRLNSSHVSESRMPSSA